MRIHFNYIWVLFKRLGILLLIYSVCRILFFLFNRNYFSDIDAMAFIGGLRFDITTITILNLPFIFLSLIPFKFRENVAYQFVLRWLFYLVNIPAILLNCIDLEYYKFTFKRSTADFFQLFFMGEDVGNALPQYFADYWYVATIFILLSLITILLYKKTATAHIPEKGGIRYFAIQSFLLIISMGVFVIFGRGGLQYRPINMSTAGLYANTKNIPLVINTPYSIIRSYGEDMLEEKKYLSDEEVEIITNPVKNYADTNETYSGSNVVLIILESFSKQYIGAFNEQSYTPFLDSLIAESYTSEFTFANGKKSMEAMPSILAGIPHLSNQPYITSTYAANHIKGLALLLKESGYNTSFYHGGNNGTMGFDVFSAVSGFDEYYGRDQYPNNADYDGTWGIFDEPYLNYYEEELNKKPQPFFSTLFTLSSHHPYKIPEVYNGKFEGGPEEIMATIQYTDFALRQFFNEAKENEWFNNSIFVITADHTSATQDPYYGYGAGSFDVPIIFYSPKGKIKEPDNKIIQHLDIMPALLDLTGYDKSFFSMGSSPFSEGFEGYMINYLNDIYWYAEGDFLMKWSDEKPLGLFRFKTDRMLENDLLLKERETAEMIEKNLKARIQLYNNRLIQNKFYKF